jgi:oxalate---CoA ligase
MSYQSTSQIETERPFDAQPLPPSKGTIGEWLEYFAQTQPEHAAFASSDFPPLPYSELLRQIGVIRMALRQSGFDRNARIAVAMPNGPWAALAIAAVTCSAVSIPVNPRQTIEEIERSFAALRPDAILLLRGDNSSARQAAEHMGATIIELEQAAGNTLGFSVAGDPGPSTAGDAPGPDSHAFILQTSGTTSEPKLIPTSHRNMLAAAARVQVWFDLTPQDRCLSASPVFYAHGLHVTVFATLLSGGTVVFPADTAKFDAAEWFETLRPTWYSAGPALHRLVLDHIGPAADGKLRHTLRFAVSGGAPLPKEILSALQQSLGVPVLEHYGSSEGMQICANQLPPGRSKLGTCGSPWPNTIKIVDDKGEEVPAGERGEILVGGPTVVSGYLNASELSRTCFVDGWYRSGDVGSMDQDGFLSLHGRKDDLINRGGEKISPAEIDAVLLRHPAIAEAAAFAVPHPRLGQDIAAAVVFRHGMEVEPGEVRQYLRSHVAAFKVPRQIMVREQLPKGATGKILRRVLAEASRAKATEPAEPVPPEVADGKVVEWVIKLTEMWERLLRVKPLSMDDDFFEKGGDSLLAMDFLAELDQLTGDLVPASILMDASTIRLLAYALARQGDKRPTNLVKINPDGRKPPLVLFHGDYIWGGGHLSSELTKLLGPNQPLLVVAPHGGGEAFPQSVEAMAAERLPLIFEAQPDGPYRICGYCVGAIVAFEAARQLVAAGKEVDIIVMLDPPTVNAGRATQSLLSAISTMRRLLGPAVDRPMAWTWYQCAEFQKFFNVSRARRWAAIKKRVGRPARGIGNLARGPTPDPRKSTTSFSSFARFTDARTARYAAAMSSYRPRPLAIRGVYISVDYGPGNWGRLVSKLDVVKSSGTHFELNFPHIASVLGTYLDAIER